MVKCPGQDQRNWKPEDVFDVRCPNCNNNIELWKDEPSRKCPACKQTVWNPKIDIGCAQWCQYATVCFGSMNSDQILCQKLLAEMKTAFGKDTKRIEHNLAVLSYADKLQQAEGGDPLVIKAAAILHTRCVVSSLTDKELHAVRPCGQNNNSEEADLAIRSIISRQKIEPQTAEHIGLIITNLPCQKKLETIEFQIVSDADRLARLEEGYFGMPEGPFEPKTDSEFMTNTGRQLAEEIIAKKTRRDGN